MQEIEEKLAHLIRTVDDLSDVVAAQECSSAMVASNIA